MRRDFDRFQVNFDSTDVVMLSWPGCQIDDPALPVIEQQIRRGPHASLFDYLVSGDSIYRTLVNDMELSQNTSIARLQGALIGPDGKQTCLVAALSEHGSRQRATAIEHLMEVLREAGIAHHQVRAVGPASDLHNIDFEGFWSPLRAVPLIALLAFLLTWLFVRELRLAMFINSVSAFAGMLALSLVYLSGHPLNVLVWTMPTLVLLLTISAALHFLAYYKDAASRFGIDGAAGKALKLARRPIVYCAVTTAAGLFSLVLSELKPIQEFGFFGGVSVLASCGLVLTLLPAWLTAFPAKFASGTRPNHLRTFWKRLANFCFRFRKLIIGVSLAAIVWLLFQFPDLKTGVSNSDLFRSDSRVMQDAGWFEAQVCPLSTIEVVLRFDNASVSHDVDRFRLLRRIDREFRSMDLVSGVISPATYAPVFPKDRGRVGDLVKRRVMRSRIKEIKQRLLESGFISQSDDESSEAWRMTVYRHPSTSEQLKLLTQRLKEEASQTFAASREQRFADETLAVTTTGHAVLVDHVERQFLNDLAITYSTAFVLISLVILFLMRTSIAILVATPPNLFPAVAVLGSIAACGIHLDVGSLLTASVALGIAVDDTLHFLLWWREKVRGGMASRDAIVDAMEHCGAAMIQTTVVCGLSVTLYAYCGFLPTIRFGLLLASMLFVAIVGDLIILPAILSTSLGRKLADRRNLKHQEK